METAIHYPVMFTYQDLIFGDGFLTDVTIRGRAAIQRDGDTWWMYGVRPAGIAEHGGNPAEAFLNFRSSYKEVLFDIADECEDYDSFKTEVERFFHEPDHLEEEKWNNAYQLLKDGKVEPEPPFFSALPKQSPESRPTAIDVTRLDSKGQRQSYSANYNKRDVYEIPAEMAA